MEMEVTKNLDVRAHGKINTEIVEVKNYFSLR
jgi:hypothetical protein